MYYYAIFEELASAAFGPNGVHLRRCRSLNLRLSDDDYLSEAIWSLLNAEAPKMERLLLLSYTPLPKSNSIPRLKLPSVTRLAISNHITLKNVPVCLKLRELDISTSSWEGFEILNHLTVLETLRLGYAYTNCRDIGVPPRILLPSLKLFHIRANCPVFLVELFHFMNLPRLILEISHFPSLFRADCFNSVECMVYRQDPNYSQVLGLRNFASELFVDSFPRLQKVKIILVPHEIREAALRVAKACKADGELPALHCIQMIGSSGKVVETVHGFE